jgi:hypothetical protein
LAQEAERSANAAGSHPPAYRKGAGKELKPRTVAAIRTALEAAGVIFVEENGEGPGVRLRKVQKANASPQTIQVEDLNAENDE